MDQVDAIFKHLAARRRVDETVIACLYTGERLPMTCAPMPRDPAPLIDIPFDARLGANLDGALAENPAIHDGAIMIGRLETNSDYRITGWSFRLFPGARNVATAANRGSAFHSCLAMSCEAGIDATFLISARRAYRFQAGTVVEL